MTPSTPPPPSRIPSATPSPLLDVTDLLVEGGHGGSQRPLVDGVSFDVDAGRTLGLVGESGSGKTLTALSVLGLLPLSVRLARGTVAFEGRDLTGLPPRQLRSIRGREIGVVFQDPAGNLDPAFTVGSQLVETLRAHTGESRKAAREHAVSLLDRVGIPQPAKRMHDYPHQLSGGMAQRVMIALATSCRPKLLIADEPTTALDVTVQAQILTLLRSLQEEYGMAMLLISHDLSVVAEMADEVVVMYAGQVVERGEIASTFHRPQHPYTTALLGAQPGGSARGHALVAIAGAVPGADALPDGCRFHPRCSHAQPGCVTAEPALVAVSPDSAARCIRQGELSLAGVSDQVPDESVDQADDPVDRPVLAEARGLGKDYRLRSGRPWSRSLLRAVDEVSFVIRAGETLGLVGESGAGKTTVGRLILGLEEPTRGQVVVDGADLHRVRGRHRRELRRDIQVVFQNPHGSLDPMMTVGATLAEPLEVHTTWGRERIGERVGELLAQVGLDPMVATRHPDALSGGQRQRVAIARALALRPRLIVCDEPVSALDVSTQAQVLNLLSDLQRELGVAYLVIGHDLSVMYHVSDRLAVMQGGQIVEMGPSEQIYHDPQHPYTRRLLGAGLSIDPNRRRLGTSDAPGIGRGGIAVSSGAITSSESSEQGAEDGAFS